MNVPVSLFIFGIVDKGTEENGFILSRVSNKIENQREFCLCAKVWGDPSYIHFRCKIVMALLCNVGMELGF